MEIFVAKSAGFCFGVKRAINMAREHVKDKKGDVIYTLGPIIHNPQVVDELKRSNIIPKNGVDKVDCGTAIIRSHGITLNEYELARKKGLKLIDATCPFVKKSQDIASNLCEEGYFLIVVGEKEHPEVRGILSYSKGDKIVASSIDEIRDMPKKKKIGIIAQTTLPIEILREVVCFCLTRTGELKVFNTICNATAIRQKESSELARNVDCVVVVGGRNSANTKRLVQLCQRIQPLTYHVEVASELNPLWFNGISRVGITAGASTPEYLIDDVITFLRTLPEGKYDLV